MKHLSFNGNIVIKSNQLDSFKEEMKNLLDKYSVTELSRSATINVTYNLEYIHEDYYQAGRIFKLDMMNKNLYFLFISVSKTSAIALVLEESELDYIQKYANRKDLFTGIDFIKDSIQNLYFERTNYFIPKISSSTDSEEIAEISWRDIDFNLVYHDSFDKKSIANIVAQLM